MISQNQFLSQQRFHSPTVHTISKSQKVNVFFTYQTSPIGSPQQSLKVIKELKESRKKKKIFEPRRKLSFRSIDTSMQKRQKLRIFDEPRKRISTMKSHILLKDSAISGVETIVDQLQQLEQCSTLKNPITKKLENIKNRQHTKRTFYSNVQGNSFVQNERTYPVKRNRIDSEVLAYNYCPATKNRSSVTVKASKQNRMYGVSKFSNGLSILTNERNMFSELQDAQNVETPRYHRSTYRQMRKSFQPTVHEEFDRKQQSRKQSIQIPDGNRPYTDRFYDESSLQTPRLPMVTKKVSYELIDPLTSSLRKQKLQKKQLKKLHQQQAAKLAKKQSRLKTFIFTLVAMITQVVSSVMNTVTQNTQKCISFTRSEVFIVLIIVMLSLTIFMIQLFQ